MLESLKEGSKIIGVKQTIKTVETDRARVVFIAKDADEKVTLDLKELCNKKSIEIIYVDSMKQLGRACGIEVRASAACLKE